jgi:nicotinate-nucleotide pyrophosphorylase (carboxylating)
MVMLKDNHVNATGSIRLVYNCVCAFVCSSVCDRNAVSKAKSAAGFSVKVNIGTVKNEHYDSDCCNGQVEVETSTWEAACEAVEAGADVVMLDNLDPPVLHEMAHKLKSKYAQSFRQSNAHHLCLEDVFTLFC